MTWFIGQSILIIAVAFLLGLLVGWLIWGRILRSKPAESADAAAPAVVEPLAVAEVAAPLAEPEPEPAAVELAEPDLAPEPVAEPEPVADEPEPEPVAEPDLAPEPVAAEPVAEEEPEPVAVEPEPEPVAVEPEPEPEPAAADEPESLVVAQAAAPAIEVIPDNLERIEGIGPKMAGALIKSGIRTYEQLAVADQGVLREAIESDGLKFAPSLVTWSRQARLLADGDEEGFEDLTRRLVAGRDEGRE